MAGRRGLAAPGTVAALLLTVVVLDQATKWWAWRHAPVAHINGGGNPFVGPTIGGWYAAPVTGTVLDLIDLGLLSAGVAMVVRGTRPAIIRVPAALMIAGWTSNLLDRLGVHLLTAPGSGRGAVDFIPVGSCCYNLADFVIAPATAVYVLAGAYLAISRRFRTELRPRQETA